MSPAFTCRLPDGRCLAARPATEVDADRLAAFFRANPGYDLMLFGTLPDAAEWVEDFLSDVPPEAFGATATHKLVVTDDNGEGPLLAIIDVSENLLSPGVAHLGLFQVAEAEHGSGLAHELYRALEAWMAGRGMDAFRLGVLEANGRGQRFWARHNYRLTRLREVSVGPGHVSQVMFKTLAACDVDEWRARVQRDHPDAP
jgi:GNAT superfamily N-acetyltransferase